jgi:hypothetical protein
VALSINCATKVISVPQADLTYISPNLYGLNIEDFRLWLKDWEDSEEGMAMPDTHRRNAPVTLSGSTYAQTFEVINGYTVTFENGSYRVRVAGGNHNIGDVMNPNSVSIEIGNSAGLIAVDTGGGGTAPTEGQIAAAVWAYVSRGLTEAVQANAIQINDAEVIGDGTAGNPWRGVGVSP